MNTVELFIKFEKAENAVAEAKQAFAISMAQKFTLAMSFKEYEEESGFWKKAYREMKRASEEASQKAFERALLRMNEYLRSVDAETFVTPRSENDSAKKMAESRAREKEACEKLLNTLEISASDSSTTAQDKLSKTKRVSNEARAVALAFIAQRAKEEAKEEAKKADEKRRDLLKTTYDTLKTLPLTRLEEVAESIGALPPSVKAKAK